MKSLLKNHSKLINRMGLISIYLLSLTVVVLQLRSIL